jgi:hypothetical protein
VTRTITYIAIVAHALAAVAHAATFADGTFVRSENRIRCFNRTRCRYKPFAFGVQSGRRLAGRIALALSAHIRSAARANTAHEVALEVAVSGVLLHVLQKCTDKADGMRGSRPTFLAQSQSHMTCTSTVSVSSRPDGPILSSKSRWSTQNVSSSVTSNVTSSPTLIASHTLVSFIRVLQQSSVAMMTINRLQTRDTPSDS